MLNPFPELLVFGLLAPTIVRVTLGFLLLHSAALHLKPDARIRIGADFSAVKFNVLGANAAWCYIVLEVAVGALLIIGFYTQIAALLGIIISTVPLLFSKRFPSISGESGMHHALVIAAYTSLLLSGAGALAVDLPL